MYCFKDFCEKGEQNSRKNVIFAIGITEITSYKKK